jgi:hypothetical protein
VLDDVAGFFALLAGVGAALLALAETVGLALPVEGAGVGLEVEGVGWVALALGLDVEVGALDCARMASIRSAFLALALRPRPLAMACSSALDKGDT